MLLKFIENTSTSIKQIHVCYRNLRPEVPRGISDSYTALKALNSYNCELILAERNQETLMGIPCPEVLKEKKKWTSSKSRELISVFKQTKRFTSLALKNDNRL